MTAEFPVAVHALVYLMHTDRPTMSGELADNICTNPARVRKIMAKLHRSGLVLSREGRCCGGYQTLEKAADITLTQVLSALEESPVEVNWRPGDVDRNCQVSSGMAAVMDGVYSAMNEKCMDVLDTITIGSISKIIFSDKEEK